LTISCPKTISAWSRKGLLLLALAMGVAACSSSTPLSGYQEGSASEFTASAPDAAPSAVKPASQQTTQEVSRLFEEYSVPDQGGSAADYRLAPMDVVDVSVFEAPNLSRTAQVSASGFITLPLIEDVKAAGKTTDQLQRDIASRLQKDFMQSPQVFVSVKEYNSQRVTVDGAVKNPGIFPLKGETTLIQVLASAGGLNEMATPSGIYVLRKTDGKKTAARFDLREIRSGKKDDPVMRAGDIVIVDESGGKVALRGLREAMGFTGLFSLLML
jgi:polysaccharide export outer membrane protein